MGVEKGGVLFLSGQSASQYDPGLGRVVCMGDVVEQARLVYEKLGRVLEAAGAGFDNVVKTVDYLAPQGLAGYRGTAEVRRKHFKGSWPASTGVVVERLLRADALIEVDAVAVLDAKKHAINPGWPRYDNLTYHPGVRAGDLLSLSGFTGALPSPQAPLLEDQMANIDRSIEAVLREAGATQGDLVKRVDYVAPGCCVRSPV
jgi:enamine deaminase RidA (YjgF/YER057c/UK114 family)